MNELKEVFHSYHELLFVVHSIFIHTYLVSNNPMMNGFFHLHILGRHVLHPLVGMMNFGDAFGYPLVQWP